MWSPLIIGHRGASAVAPENTMAAFREAISAGADGIEFDVRLTNDGVPVIIHDRSLYRTSGLRHCIADLTSSELESLNVGVPSLEQLFTLFQSNELLLFLEMKCDSPSERVPLAEACSKLVGDYSFKERVFIESFDLVALETVKRIDSEIRTAPLFQPSLTTPWTGKWFVEQATALQASAIALDYRLVHNAAVRQVKDAGLKIAVWTVDNPTWMHRAKSIGIDALITNNPAVMLAER